MEESNESFLIYQKYLFSQVVKKDSVIREYLKSNENISPETIQKLYDFYNSIKNKKLVLEIGKGVVRGVLINTKKVICDSEVSVKDKENQSIVSKLSHVVKPIFKFIEPENITIKLTEDEYLALINDLMSKKKSGKQTNLYILIGSNMLMSLISSNIKNLLDNQGSEEVEEEDSISNEHLSNIYNKLINEEENTRLFNKATTVKEEEREEEDVESNKDWLGNSMNNDDIIVDAVNSIHNSPVIANSPINTAMLSPLTTPIMSPVATTSTSPSNLDIVTQSPKRQFEEDDYTSPNKKQKFDEIENILNGNITPTEEFLEEDKMYGLNEIDMFNTDWVGESSQKSDDDYNVDEEESDMVEPESQQDKQETSDVVINPKNTKIKQMLEEFKLTANSRKKNTNNVTNINKILPFE
ncbi:GbNV_gp67-like protein [Carcinus maenas nudivirus]|uniref:GbNV_gp67-like protein n=1 Tax=Carcinus maenas nudivirus TaxID=2880837 RepID=A0AAE9BZF1_9VIRU|nr:GbNV_gp67-like protein [Carcinus maenas nudivirus]UBZ25678.1 GbNV_gp67-like protein [Carcinus maenas nudivirus]